MKILLGSNLINLKTYWPGLIILALIIFIIILLKLKRLHRQSLSFIVANISNIGNRNSQQDSFGISNIDNYQKGCLAIISDGIGGLSNGDKISAITTKLCLQEFNFADENDIVQSLQKMVKKANDVVINYITDSKQLGGATLISTWVKQNKLYFISVGDSHIYLIRKDGMFQINRENNYGHFLDKQATNGIISFTQAKNDPQRHALNSYIGKTNDLLIDYNNSPITLLPDDYLLLASDGLFKTLNEKEIIIAINNNSPSKALSIIEHKIIDKNLINQDNFTAILFKFHN